MKSLSQKTAGSVCESLGIAMINGESIGNPDAEYNPSNPLCEELLLGRCSCQEGYARCERYKKGEITKIK
jgi:hypothetical protein